MMKDYTKRIEAIKDIFESRAYMLLTQADTMDMVTKMAEGLVPEDAEFDDVYYWIDEIEEDALYSFLNPGAGSRKPGGYNDEYQKSLDEVVSSMRDDAYLLLQEADIMEEVSKLADDLLEDKDDDEARYDLIDKIEDDVLSIEAL